ncbi:HPr family phosphocarrier protein [Cellulosilyticum sp. I15G10I2]|uniref:HPr family phosphocarrier protein n=1 Tax=Cellulosilyticum sp. I15G10I2 TaxID=1892843 RepID=UPI00085BF8A3|nr:HPr family phosphocarrier protein [Cellulosilyticum sp. I15G10I2]
MKKAIKVKNIDNIQKINQVVSKYPYDIWIHSKSGMVDAKSILGIFALSLNEELFLVTDDDVDAKGLYSELAEYMDVE